MLVRLRLLSYAHDDIRLLRDRSTEKVERDCTAASGKKWSCLQRAGCEVLPSLMSGRKKVRCAKYKVSSAGLT